MASEKNVQLNNLLYVSTIQGILHGLCVLSFSSKFQFFFIKMNFMLHMHVFLCWFYILADYNIGFAILFYVTEVCDTDTKVEIGEEREKKNSDVGSTPQLPENKEVVQIDDEEDDDVVIVQEEDFLPKAKKPRTENLIKKPGNL